MKERIEKKRICFRYHDPEAEEVYVSGSFNGWNPEANCMKKNGEGVWSTVVNLFPGIYEYRFIVDGLWKNDPVCDHYHPNRYGSQNCLLTVRGGNDQTKGNL